MHCSETARLGEIFAQQKSLIQSMYTHVAGNFRVVSFQGYRCSETLNFMGSIFVDMHEYMHIKVCLLHGFNFIDS